MSDDSKTEYVIFKATEGATFMIVGRVSIPQRARSSAAIREYLGAHPTVDQAGWYVAVPADKWTPRKANIEQQPLVTFDDDGTPTPIDPIVDPTAAAADDYPRQLTETSRESVPT